MTDEHWDTRRCANPECGKALEDGREFVMQVSTKHVRWFCDVTCVVRAVDLHHEALDRLGGRYE